MSADTKPPVTDLLANCDCILLDIEGTITSIDFVKGTLFPYFRQNVEAYLMGEIDNAEAEVDANVTAIENLAKQRVENNLDTGLVLCSNVQDRCSRLQCLLGIIDHWMHADLKLTPLKLLQGKVWQHGYETGAIQGHLYADVVPALERLQSLGKALAIYSSGSVEAQRLLVAHSMFGDMSKLFANYFDTCVGSKRESASYARISAHLKCEPSRIIFFTDIEQEAVAAQEAGMCCILVHRPGNVPLTQAAIQQFPVINSFDDLGA